MHIYIVQKANYKNKNKRERIFKLISGTILLEKKREEHWRGDQRRGEERTRNNSKCFGKLAYR